jgi:hypothetical protein
MLRLTPNFSGTFTTPPITYSPNFTSVGGLRPPKVLKKHDLTMFSKWNMWTGTFGFGSWVYRAWSGRSLSETKGDYDEGQGDHEAVRRKASAWQQKRGTDFKMKRQFRPRRVTIKLLANVKGMNIILHGLCPVPINRWTVFPYCSRWLGILLSRHACTLAFLRVKGTFIIVDTLT